MEQMEQQFTEKDSRPMSIYIALWKDWNNWVKQNDFSDAIIFKAAVALYVVVFQSPGTLQGLAAVKSRLSKKNITIPRLELVAMHMTTNLCRNIKDFLEEQLIRKLYRWTNSSVTLRWTRGRRIYKRFVSNGVNKIREKDFIIWRHVPTDCIPADIGSLGCSVDKIPTEWWNGPSWIQCQQNRPPGMTTPAGVYLLKVNNRNTKARCETCS